MPDAPVISRAAQGSRLAAALVVVTPGWQASRGIPLESRGWMPPEVLDPCR